MVETPNEVGDNKDPSAYAISIIRFTLQSIKEGKEPRYEETFEIDGIFSIASVLQTLYNGIKDDGENQEVVQTVNRIFKYFVAQNLNKMETTVEQRIFTHIAMQAEETGLLTEGEQQFITELGESIDN